MTLLYLLDVLNILTIPTGFDSLTDAIGTMWFVATWYVLAGRENHEARSAEMLLIVLVALSVFIVGGVKFGLQISNPQSEEYNSARLMLNLCNGVVMLGLYRTARGSLPPPDPASHAFIILFGCAQIAAHGRDCLSAVPACTANTVSGLVALSIAWALILGKVAFAAYISYCYFNSEEDIESTGAARPLPVGG
ncbi:MAG TPA: hypothetical protein VM512_05660 [Burkholderiaceae bacterium]|jgi:hypothetical protein|nr:hypothetical protein [Burkholderiaceae bacterium]